MESLENEDGDKKEIEKQKSPYKKITQWRSRFPSMKCMENIQMAQAMHVTHERKPTNLAVPQQATSLSKVNQYKPIIVKLPQILEFLQHFMCYQLLLSPSYMKLAQLINMLNRLKICKWSNYHLFAIGKVRGFHMLQP